LRAIFGNGASGDCPVCRFGKTGQNVVNFIPILAGVAAPG
jgi:hypothetical protein